MTPERHQQLGDLYHEALEREPQARAAFLENACNGDEQLRREVESLLAAHERVGNYFDSPALELAAGLIAKQENISLMGRSLSYYRVLSLIGAGGMGEVYLAEDTRLGRKVALKLLPKEFTQDQERVRRFEKEARAASALNHPNIVAIYEVGQIDGRHFIAIEYIEGETLRGRLSSGPIKPGEALEIGAQMASALEAAHEAGIVHRDIKPENIMLRPDGYVKVLDFGLAKLTKRGGDSGDNERETQAGRTTEAGLVLGTPRYMSPEQARGLEVDARADIFSLGVMLYEMVAGRTPFDGATTSDVIAAILKDDPPPLEEAPEELEQVIKKALAKEREARYTSVTELAAELKRLKEMIELDTKLGRVVPARPRGEKAATTGATGAATSPIETETLPVSEGKGRRRSIILALVTVLLAFAVITVFYVVSLDRGSEEAPRADPTTRELTFRRGFVTAARFAPDGKTVIYSAGFDGGPVELFTTDLESVVSRPLGLGNAGIQSISATGEMAVLLNPELHWGESRNGTLALLPQTGGTPRELIENVLKENVYEAAYGPDGKSLAIVHAPEGEFQLEYPMGDVLYKSPGWISHARVSPLGDKIAFLDHPIPTNPAGSVVVIDLRTREQSLVSTGWKTLFGLVWSAAGDEIWFCGSRENRKPDLYAVTVSGSERLLYQVASHLRVQDISADGRVLLARGDGGHSRMMHLSAVAKTERDLKTFDWSTSADLSDDGTTLLYYEWGTAVNAVLTTFLRKTDGFDGVPLGEGRALALSPNGQWALALQESSPPRLVLLPTTPGESKVLPRANIKEYHHAFWSPDNRHIIFTGLEPDSIPRSYIQDVEGGEPRPLTEEGIVALLVSQDGKRMVVLNHFNETYYLQPLDGGDPVEIRGIEKLEEPIQWTEDGRAIYVRGLGDFRCNVYRVELASGRRKLWKKISPPERVGLLGLDARPGGVLITPDGRSYVYTFWSTIMDLILVEGLK